MKISATRRLAVNRTEAGKSDAYTITKGACEMSTKVKIEIRDRIRELRRVPASHLMPHVKNSVLAETGPKTFNLDVAAEVQATLVISKCVWCGVSFVQSAPHQTFCSAKCRVTAFRKREPGEPFAQVAHTVKP